MDSASKDIREVVLEQIFPELRYGGDPDIERYFELRSQGRMLDALALYRSRLKPRYPDDKKRVVLLALFRTHSSLYQAFLHDLLMERADEIIDRIKKNIEAITAPLAHVNMKNTYAVLKAVELVARMLPDDPERAKIAAAAYENHASILKFKKNEMGRLTYLLGEFYEQAVVEELEGTDFIALSMATETERRKLEEESAKQNFFDISRIEFGQDDIRRIEIPAALTREEDKVLAYCHKYWLLVEDPAFERIIWLYSRKFETQHYDIFRTIKLGRRRKYTDDDILTMVATNLTTRYSYTVQGDIYMQSVWRRIKAGLYASGQLSTSRYLKPNSESRPSSGSTAVTTGAPTSPTQPAEASFREPIPQAYAAQASASPENAFTRAAQERAAQVQAESMRTSEARLVRSTAGAGRLADSPKKSILPDRIPTGSISDYIKRLSGRAYDVYRDIFLDRVRGAIHDVLGKSKTKPVSIFDESMNRAEDIVFRFMEENYANSYMDWPGSAELAQVRELGFNLQKLDEIIDICYKKISA